MCAFVINATDLLLKPSLIQVLDYKYNHSNGGRAAGQVNQSNGGMEPISDHSQSILAKSQIAKTSIANDDAKAHTDILTPVRCTFPGLPSPTDLH